MSRRERAVFPGIGGQFVKYQCKAHRQLGGKKQPVTVQGKTHMTIRPEFGEQEILDIASSAIDLGDQIVGRRQRSQPVIDAGPDLRLIVQYLMNHRVNGR